jgi:hypothetical protein
MPGFRDLFRAERGAEAPQPIPIENHPFDPAVIDNLHFGEIPVAAPQAQANLNNAFANVYNNQVEFGGQVGGGPVAQNEVFWNPHMAQALDWPVPEPPRYIANYNWEIRPPERLFCELPADVIEKIAQRVIVLLEERENE